MGMDSDEGPCHQQEILFMTSVSQALLGSDYTSLQSQEIYNQMLARFTTMATNNGLDVSLVNAVSLHDAADFLGSIPALPAPINGGFESKDAQVVQLLQLMFAMGDAVKEGRLEAIQETSKALKEHNEKQIADFLESLEAQEESSKWDKVAEAFTWVALAATVIATVASFGTAGFALAAVALALTLAVTIDGKTGGNMMSALGDVLGSDLAATLLVSGIILACGIGGCVMGFRAAGAAASTAKTGASAAKAGTDTAAEIAKNATLLMKFKAACLSSQGRMLQAGAEATSAAAGIGGSASSMRAAELRHDAAEAQVDMMRTEAVMEALRQFIEELIETIERTEERKTEAAETVTQMLDGSNTTNQNIIAA
jgi:hypothetical protein